MDTRWMKLNTSLRPTREFTHAMTNQTTIIIATKTKTIYDIVYIAIYTQLAKCKASSIEDGM